MAIYLRGKSWYYDFVHKGQRYTGSFGPVSKTVAKEELARKKSEVIEGKLNPAKARKSPRFDAFTADYLGWVKANKKPLTYAKAVEVMRKLTVAFGTKKLNELTAWQMEQYKKARKDAGYAPATINLELCFLKALLNKAVAWKKLTDHPGREVKGLTDTHERTRFLSEEEEAQLLAVCSPPLRRMVEVGLLTGFRRQELVYVRPEDVDFARELVSVAACYSKNGESRTLPMGDRLKAVLREAIAARGTVPRVFVTPAQRPWTLGTFQHAFRKVCVEAGLKECSPHTLRHTFASRLVMAGVDLPTVQELMGHKDIKMTLRYAHISPSHKRQAMVTLERQFSGKSPAHFHSTPVSPPAEDYTKAVSM